MPRQKILIVDDEIIIASELEARLQNLGFDVVGVALSGKEAIALAAEMQPDLVLMDINLKGNMNGIEAAAEIRRRLSIPVIYLTAYCDEKTLQRAKVTEPYGYIVKPFSEGELQANIEMALYNHAADRARRASGERTRLMSAAKMEVARTIQQRLFPVQPPLLPDCDIAGASCPAEATGGDYFDYIPMRHGSFGIVLGDVSGHGFGSALLMAETRAYLRALVLTHDDVGEILTLTNVILSEDVGDQRFMTLFFARLNPQSWSVVYAGAGHEGYLLSSSGKTRRLHSTSLPLGVDKDLVVPCAPAIELAPGDILLLVTDGFSEAKAAGAGRLFGMTRILEVVHANRSKTAREIIEVLFNATRDYSQGDVQDDDMTAVILKRKAPA